MPRNELYTKQCPVCRLLFTCVSSKGRYCSDQCRNKAYRKRKSDASDGLIHNVPKLYNTAIDLIGRYSPLSLGAIETMSLCDCSSFALKSAIYAAFVAIIMQDKPSYWDYENELKADLSKRKQLEIAKYVPDFEVA